MKFFDMVTTAQGAGAVVGRTAQGDGLLLAIRKEAWKGKRVVTGPCVNVLAHRCEQHGVWYVQGEGCPGCWNGGGVEVDHKKHERARKDAKGHEEEDEKEQEG